MENDDTPRKRQKRTPKCDDKGKGRPRIQPKDETAADRRRTQIRVAQRAYRQRKEATLDELRSRVNELSTTINSMNTSFREFANQALTHNLPWEVSNGLQGLLTLFADVDSDDMSPEPKTSDDQLTQTLSAVDVLEDLDITTPVGLEAAHDTRTNVNANTANNYPLNLGYPISFDNGDNKDLITNPQTNSLMPKIEEQLQPQVAEPFSISGSLDSAINLLSSFKPTFTYNIDETSFAGRLHRRCLEIGQQFLSQPFQAPSVYQHASSLALRLGKDYDSLRQRLQYAVNQVSTAYNDASLYSFPNMAGAMSQYSDPTSQSLVTLPSSIVEALMEAVREFENEWLDPTDTDVEDYLASRGLWLDPVSSYTEPDPNMQSFPAPALLNTGLVAPGVGIQDYSPLSQQPPDLSAIENFDFTKCDWLSPAYPDYTQPQMQMPSNPQVQPALSHAGSSTTAPSPDSHSQLPSQNLAQTLIAPLLQQLSSRLQPGVSGEQKQTVQIDAAKLLKLLTLCAAYLAGNNGAETTGLSCEVEELVRRTMVDF